MTKRKFNLNFINLINFILISSCFLIISCTTGKQNQNAKNQSTNPISVIFDTDIQGDYDDVGAIAMLHAFADSGYIEILATMASNRSPLVVPTIDVINTYFGRPEIPIGVLKEGGVSQDSRELHWPDSLIAHFPHKYQSNDEASDAVEVYRRILSEQPDTSVTIISVGFLTNLKNLLLSKPDSLSSLDGRDLVAQKVKHWVAMAGGFPEGKEANVRKDSTSSVYAIDNWPTPIIFSGFEIGLQIKTGLRLINDCSEENPIRMAYAISIPKRPYDKEGRRSWDQTAVLAAVKGFDPYFKYQAGCFITSKDGSNYWKNDPNGKHKHLVMKMQPDSLTTIIEDLMMHQPKSQK
ncbi:nucleoside hydrolase [Sunxiuqinia sp. A32]|uniref:nucleoside hydrolase n=1 Tax=Sunxiuqinia sp. A32 TaxID=3461496 RepID=UPI00404599AB